MTKNKKNNMDADYGVDSRYKSNNERESDATVLMEARLRRMKNLSKDQITKAKLLQLKLKTEEYIKNPVYDDNNYFSGFLKLYIDSIYSKRNIFAKDTSSFAYYLFKEGFGYLCKDFKMVYDYRANELIQSEGVFDSTDVERGKALMQNIQYDFLQLDNH